MSVALALALVAAGLAAAAAEAARLGALRRMRHCDAPERDWTRVAAELSDCTSHVRVLEREAFSAKRLALAQAAELSDAVERAQSALAREVIARAAERSGRVRAERGLRKVELRLLTTSGGDGADLCGGNDGDVTDSTGDPDRVLAAAASRAPSAPAKLSAAPAQSAPPVFPLAALGTFHSSFSQRNGTPRQPQLVPMARGRVTLHPHIPAAALDGLHEFSHVWLVYVFHANTDLQQSLGRAVQVDPRLTPD
jgi:hypothetical protein